MQRIVAMVLLIVLVACASGEPTPTQVSQQPTQAAERTTAKPATTAPTIAAPTVETVPPKPLATATAAPAVPPVTTDGMIVFSDHAILNGATGQATIWNSNIPNSNKDVRWALSPDMAVVAFADYVKLTQDGSESFKDASLWLSAHDGTNQRQVMWMIPGEIPKERLKQLHDNPPLWSSTGEVITLSFHQQQPDLYAVDSRTDTIRRLTNTPELETNLAIDSSGTKLGYLTHAEAGNQAWIQPLTGTATPIATNGEPQIGHGWIGEQFFFTAINHETFQPSVIGAYANGDIAELPIWGERISLDGVPNHIIVAAAGAGSPAKPTLIWDGADAVQAIATPPLSKISVSPNRQLIYGCFKQGMEGRQQIFDLTGAVVWEGNPSCTSVHWSPDSQYIALEPTMFVGISGIGGLQTLLLKLPNAAGGVAEPFDLAGIPGSNPFLTRKGWKPIGWIGEELIYGIDEGNDPNVQEWQVFRRNPTDPSTERRIGKRILNLYDPRFILPAGAVPPQPAPPIANPTSIQPPQAVGNKIGSGKVIVPVYDEGSVTMIDLATLNATYLVDPASNLQLSKVPMAFSPDQQTMAVLLNAGPWNYDLWTVNTDGSNPRMIKSVPAVNESHIIGDPKLPVALADSSERGPLIWTPGNELIVLGYQNERNESYDIFAINPSSGEARRLTNTSKQEYNLVLNPAGTRLAYLSGSVGGFESLKPTQIQLWVQDLNGAPQELLANDPILKLPNVRILGWLGDTLILDSIGTESRKTTVVGIGPDGAVKTLKYPTEYVAYDILGDNSLLIGALIHSPDFSQTMYQWDGRGEPQSIPGQATYRLFGAPDGEHFIGCEGPTQSGSTYWIFDRQGTQTTIGLGNCQLIVHWSPDQQYAMFGAKNYSPDYPSYGEAALIIDMQGNVLHNLGNGSIPAGWIDGDALYFAYLDGAWQLFRLTPGMDGRGQYLTSFEKLPDQPFSLSN